MAKTYRLEDLHIGMQVKFQELDSIYGFWIYFDDYNTDNGGKIICIAEDSCSDEARKALETTGNRLIVFHQDAELSGDEVIVID